MHENGQNIGGGACSLDEQLSQKLININYISIIAMCFIFMIHYINLTKPEGLICGLIFRSIVLTGVNLFFINIAYTSLVLTKSLIYPS